MVIGLVTFTLLMGYMKFQEERFARFSHSMRDSNISQKDLYEILQVSPSASGREIKKQYQKLVALWHPDKNPGCGKSCDEKFGDIKAAFEILGNAEKKASYDEVQFALF